MMNESVRRAREQGLSWLVAVVTALVLCALPGCTGEIGEPTQRGAIPGPPSGAMLNCPTGQLLCNGSCSDTSRDAANCGMCGRGCPSGSLCEAGACTTLCAQGDRLCGDRCVSVSSDLDNCGACGNACALGQFCNAGVCSATCALQQCAAGGRMECVDTRSSPKHCGACGNACPAGQSCTNGVCALVCPTGRSSCGGQCVDTTSDVKNCGGCGVLCDPDEPCVQGRCGCPEGSAICGGVCTDTRSSAENCGGCGVRCGADQVCDQGACKAKAQGCSNGSVACGGTCVDVNTSAAHCGMCDRACPTSQVCVAGNCACAAGQQLCAGACVDPTTDAANCGACGTSCSGGRTCQQGSCACPTGQAFCGDRCVDTQADDANCGACGMACSDGKTCIAGQCACGPDKMLCNGACVDTKSNDQNCGGCGMACSLGQACTAGTCGGGGALRDDGCMGLAQNLTVSQIAVFQTVKIPIMQNGMEVAVAARNTDVITGRDALFRIYASVGSGWASRELSARVFVQNGSTVEMFSAKANLRASSTEQDLATTFQVKVPKGKLTRDSRYAVEVVECGTPPGGMVMSPRFPGSDGAALGARDTGPLKIRILPLRVNSMVPDTSETGLKIYKDLFLALYPISEVQMTVAEPLTITSATDWTGNLDRVRQRRQQDAAPADTYYYGLLKPAGSLREFCGSGCTTGIGYVPQGSGGSQASQRASMGIGFADNASADTMAHEIAHNHGRGHAPCGSGISGVDGNFPYMGGQIGVYGYDIRNQMLIAPTRTDLMGYCNSKWLSDYTYDALLNRVATVNAAASVFVAPELVRPWNVLLLDNDGPRWGAPIDVPSAPAGEPEPAEILDEYGTVIGIETVYRTEISDIEAYSFEVPTPEPEWYAIRIAGAPPLVY